VGGRAVILREECTELKIPLGCPNTERMEGGGKVRAEEGYPILELVAKSRNVIV